MSGESNIYAFRPPDKPETQRKVLKDPAQQEADFKKEVWEVKIWIAIAMPTVALFGVAISKLAWLFSPIP